MSDAREARYAEAIRHADVWALRHLIARAVMAVADEEQAGLRAEVERVRREGLGWAEEWKSRVREVAAERDRLAAALSAATDRAEMEARTANEWHALRLAAEDRLRKVAAMRGKGSPVVLDNIWGTWVADSEWDAVLAAPPAAPEAAEASDEAGYWLTSKPSHGWSCDCDDESGHVEQREWIPAPVSSGEAGTGEACCEWHSRTCEPPSELCCERCSEGQHPQHPVGVACVLACAFCRGCHPAELDHCIHLPACPAPVVAPSAEEPAEGGA